MSARSLQGRLAAESRHRPNEDHTDLRRQHKAQRLADHVSAVLADAPPLTDEQRLAIAALLRPTAAGGGPDV